MKFIFLFIRPLIYFKEIYLRKIIKRKETFKFNKNNLYNWMNLSKKERFILSKKDSEIYSIERKKLVDQIRNEYKKITK
tara:strand:+ start:465 stop:701 length:237 start_codon:yes stop_codon:yes gene_type:complete